MRKIPESDPQKRLSPIAPVPQPLTKETSGRKIAEAHFAKATAADRDTRFREELREERATLVAAAFSGMWWR